MKGLLRIISMLFLTICLFSCSKNDENIIQFERVLYSAYEGGTVDVVVTTNKPTSDDLDIELQFSGSLEDITLINSSNRVSSNRVSSNCVSSNCVSFSEEPKQENKEKEDFNGKATIRIPKGENRGSISLMKKNSTENQTITIDIITPSGYIKGTKYRSYLVSESEEAVVCSFKYKSATLLEKYIAEVSIIGAVSGKNFTSLNNIEIPIKLTGKNANLVSLKNNFVTIPAGEKKGYVTLNIANQNYHDGFKNCKLEIDKNNNPRILVGENPHMDISICGIQTPQALIGEWEYDFVYNQEELMMWFEEMEDDPNELPLHNNGFKLIFSEKDGKVFLTPSGTGDYQNFFRKSEIVLTKPINYPSGTILLGKYSTDESNMFMEDVKLPRQQNTYYKLSKANRAFSADEEKIGEAVIVFSLKPDGSLDMQFRDYDEPPFGFMWWDSNFDASMFGFATSFKRIK